jgi:hypothetical protein
MVEKYQCDLGRMEISAEKPGNATKRDPCKNLSRAGIEEDIENKVDEEER